MRKMKERGLTLFSGRIKICNVNHVMLSADYTDSDVTDRAGGDKVCNNRHKNLLSLWGTKKWRWNADEADVTHLLGFLCQLEVLAGPLDVLADLGTQLFHLLRRRSKGGPILAPRLLHRNPFNELIITRESCPTTHLLAPEKPIHWL